MAHGYNLSHHAARPTAMTLYDEDSKLLTPGAFAFVLESELKRAVRSQSHLTLVTIEASGEDVMKVTADDETLRQVGELIGREVRDTDLLGQFDSSTLALVLLDADFEHSGRVINRLVSRFESYAFPTPMRLAVGAACYPTDAVDAGSLKRQALSRTVAHWRSGPPSPSADQN
jgi:PleD family two-component response regulator